MRSSRCLIFMKDIKVIEVKKKELDLKEWVKRSAREGDYKTLITEPCILVEDGKIKIVYDHFDGDTTRVVKALNKIRYSVGLRTRGLKSTSRIFGFRPRTEMRQDYCSSTSLAMEAPKEHQVVCDLALQLEEVYKTYDPEGYKKHKEMTDTQVKDAWKINETSLFTSGIINKNNPLKYHFDTGNFTDVYSMMIVFKGGVEGGYLSVPEYDVAFALPTTAFLCSTARAFCTALRPSRSCTSGATATRSCTTPSSGCGSASRLMTR